MTVPSSRRLFEVLDATWPAAAIFDKGPWRLRRGDGGGQRVSAATAIGQLTEEGIAQAEVEMRSVNQTPLFMLKDNEIELDNQLNLAGYDLVDPVFIYLANARDLTYEQAVSSTMSSWPPLATQIEVWAKGGIGSDRIAIMERCQKPKTSLLGRSADVPAGTSFVAIDEDIAMIHAIEVSPDARRKGVGRNLIQGAATWCVQKGAKWLCLAVTQSNGPANDLYRSLKMTEACSYHYRRAQSVNL